jgi:hypothetical protein
MLRAAAVLAWVAGLGFGLPCIVGIRHFARNHEVWVFMGFPTYGDGPFVAIGLDNSVRLMIGFLVVCLAEVGIGWLLWQHSWTGAVLSLALLPFELVFWIGFALPFGPLLGIARAGLVVAALLSRSPSGA